MKKSLWQSFFLMALLAGSSALWAAELVVYKSATCGCCSKWVDHLRANGLDVKTHNVENVNAYKTRHGVPADLGSCHTATVGGYVIEGHVPAQDIKRLLKERPKVVGLAVPNMPLGSPGMEQGDMKQPYDVFSFDKAGNRSVYARY